MSQNLFLKTRPSTLFMKAAIPGGISMLASSLYGVFESIFVGKFLGTTAYAAFGIAFPFIIMNFALAELIGVGSSVPISIFLGQKKDDKANNYFTCSILLTIFTGIISGLIIFFGAPVALRLIGADGELLELAVRYLRIYAVCSPIATLIFALDNYLRISGKMKTSMILNIFFSFFAILLVFLFVRVIPLGITGAALGSCIAMIVCVLFILALFAPGKLQLKFVRPRFSKGMISKIYKNGFAPFLTNISGRLFSIAMNVMLLKMGGEQGVAVYTVIMTLAGIIEQLLYGVVDSLQPVIGYNYGAKCFDRVKQIEKYIFTTGATISIVGGIIMFLFPSTIATPFLEDLTILDMAVFAIKISSFAYVTKWLATSIQCFFMALEKPSQAMIISVSSSCVFPLLLIPALLPFKLTGLWLNYPLSALLTTVLAVVILFAYKNKLFVTTTDKTQK
ncbi:MAG: MATE family efflux transporter [Eubacteriales bacterium]|nr:MATE family efflux transporter [Eubacteriales bacterium]